MNESSLDRDFEEQQMVESTDRLMDSLYDSMSVMDLHVEAHLALAHTQMILSRANNILLRELLREMEPKK